MPAYFSSFGLSLSQLVTVALPGTACCLYTCISLRVFLLSPPPPPPLSLPPLSACLPACLSDCLSVSPFQSPTPTSPPPPPLSLRPPLSPLPSFLPPVFCVPSFFSFFFIFGFSVVILFCFLSCAFFPLDFLLHVQVLSVCNIALAVCILSS